MRPKLPFPDGTTEQMQKLLEEVKDLNSYKRVQCIYFRAKFDYSADLITKITGYKLQTVRNIHSAFLKYGLQALEINQKGGRNHELLSINQEKKLIEEFEQKAKDGGIIEISKIHTAYEKTVGKKIAQSTTYRMLDRHNWRKITPRPTHPKSNIEVMENFKK